MKIKITHPKIYIIVSFLCIYVILASLVSIVIPNTYLRVAIVWIALLTLMNSSRIYIYKSDLWLFPFIMIMFVSLTRGTHTAIFDIMILLPFVFIMFIMRSKRTMIPVIYNLLFVADIVYAIITFIFFFNKNLYVQVVQKLFPWSSQRLLEWYQEGCMAGLTSHYTINGILMATGLMLAFSQWYMGYVYGKKIKNSLFLVLVMLVALLLTGKRGPLIFCIAGIFIVYYISLSNRPHSRWIRIIGVILAAFIVGIIVFAYVPALGTFINRFIETNESGDVTLGRTKYWLLALDNFKKNPLFGIGWGKFETMAMAMYDKSADVHNVYLQLLCETGLVGTITFIMFAFVSLKAACKCYYNNVRKNITTDKYLVFAIAYQVFFLLYGFTGNPLYTPTAAMPYFICCGIALAYKRYGGNWLHENRNINIS